MKTKIIGFINHGLINKYFQFASYIWAIECTFVFAILLNMLPADRVKSKSKNLKI